jgi:glycerol-3-phosphate acyltransferase PlsY
LQAFYQVPDLSIAMAVFSAVFVVFAHRENIKRIRDGSEHKLEFGKNKKNKKKDQ